MWDQIRNVSTGLSLVAFVSACIFLGFLWKLRQKEKLIKSASEKDRGPLIGLMLQSFAIDTRRLPPDKLYDLALDQSKRWQARYYFAGMAGLFLAVLAAAVMIAAMLIGQPQTERVEQKPAPLSPQMTPAVSLSPSMMTPKPNPSPVLVVPSPNVQIAPTSSPVRVAETIGTPMSVAHQGNASKAVSPSKTRRATPTPSGQDTPFFDAPELAGVLAIQPGLFAQSPVGIWADEDKDTFEIYRDGAKLSGKIIGLVPLNGPDGKPPTDKKNPDASKRNVPVVGLVIIRDLKEASGGKWRDGTIYDPESGKTYSCSLQTKGDNALEVYASYGPFWHTEHWTRVVGDVKLENKP